MTATRTVSLTGSLTRPSAPTSDQLTKAGTRLKLAEVTWTTSTTKSPQTRAGMRPRSISAGMVMVSPHTCPVPPWEDDRYKDCFTDGMLDPTKCPYRRSTDQGWDETKISGGDMDDLDNEISADQGWDETRVDKRWNGEGEPPYRPYPKTDPT